MIVITITISIVYALILIFLAVTWYKDLKHKEDTDKRILVLEKRDAEKATKKNVNEDINHLIDMGTEQDIILNELNRRVEKLERKHISKNS